MRFKVNESSLNTFFFATSGRSDTKKQPFVFLSSFFYFYFFFTFFVSIRRAALHHGRAHENRVHGQERLQEQTGGTDRQHGAILFSKKSNKQKNVFPLNLLKTTETRSQRWRRACAARAHCSPRRSPSPCFCRRNRGSLRKQPPAGGGAAAAAPTSRS